MCQKNEVYLLLRPSSLNEECPKAAIMGHLLREKHLWKKNKTTYIFVFCLILVSKLNMQLVTVVGSYLM